VRMLLDAAIEAASDHRNYRWWIPFWGVWNILFPHPFALLCFALPCLACAHIYVYVYIIWCFVATK
jgi:hypothetical protein